MKRLAVLAIAVFATFTACGAKSPTSASSNPNQVKFTATLLPSNEVPAVTNAENSGRGTGTLTLNLTKDNAGTITAATADMSFDATGFPAGTPITLAHIHPGAAGATGSPIINMGLGAGEIVLANGSQTGITKTGLAVTAAQAQDIIANPANYYFNIHSTTNPSGVARGQLVKQ